jgi:hypothetical protein
MTTSGRLPTATPGDPVTVGGGLGAGGALLGGGVAGAGAGDDAGGADAVAPLTALVVSVAGSPRLISA